MAVDPRESSSTPRQTIVFAQRMGPAEMHSDLSRSRKRENHGLRSDDAKKFTRRSIHHAAPLAFENHCRSAYLGGPVVAEFGPTFVEFGPVLVDAGPSVVELVKFRPHLVKFGPNLACVSIWSKSAQTGATWLVLFPRSFSLPSACACVLACCSAAPLSEPPAAREAAAARLWWCRSPRAPPWRPAGSNPGREATGMPGCVSLCAYLFGPRCAMAKAGIIKMTTQPSTADTFQSRADRPGGHSRQARACARDQSPTARNMRAPSTRAHLYGGWRGEPLVGEIRAWWMPPGVSRDAPRASPGPAGSVDDRPRTERPQGCMRWPVRHSRGDASRIRIGGGACRRPRRCPATTAEAPEGAIGGSLRPVLSGSPQRRAAGKWRKWRRR